MLHDNILNISESFGYDKEIIEGYLNSKNIVKEFEGLFDENGRKVVRLSEEDLEKMDLGYDMLKKQFSGITYSEFRSNKIVVDKNEKKLFKHLLSLGATKSFLEQVSKYKLPNTTLYFVVSTNYEDMILASTKNSFTSCIDLTKGEYAATTFGNIFSNGRCIIYLTDLTEKEYLGVKSYKMFLRCFGLIDTDGNLRSSLIYPLRTKMGFDVDGIKIKPVDTKTKSKYNYDIILNDFGFMVFPYIDNGSIVKSAKSGGYIENYGKAKNKSYVINDDKLFDYKFLLKYFDGEPFNIKNLIKKHCDCCGSYKQKIVTLKGRNYCEDCIDRMNVVCDFCGKPHKKIRTTLEGKIICETCRKKKQLTICKCCGGVFEGSREITQCVHCSLKKDDVYKKISYLRNNNYYDFELHLSEGEIDDYLEWDEELGEYIDKGE